MIELGSFFAGLIVLFAVRAACVTLLINRAASVPKDTDAPTADTAAWLAIATYRSNGGRYIGALESVLFYSAFLYAGDAVEFIVAGYLAFKVASKWEVWAHVYRVPDEIKGVDPAKFLHFRARWGAYLFDRFVIGTLLSLLTAGLAVAAELYTRELLIDASIRGFSG